MISIIWIVLLVWLLPTAAGYYFGITRFAKQYDPYSHDVVTWIFFNPKLRAFVFMSGLLFSLAIFSLGFIIFGLLNISLQSDFFDLSWWQYILIVSTIVLSCYKSSQKYLSQSLLRI